MPHSKFQLDNLKSLIRCFPQVTNDLPSPSPLPKFQFSKEWGGGEAKVGLNLFIWKRIQKVINNNIRINYLYIYNYKPTLALSCIDVVLKNLVQIHFLKHVLYITHLDLISENFKPMNYVS